MTRSDIHINSVSCYFFRKLEIKKPKHEAATEFMYGDPEAIRTLDMRLRSYVEL